MDWLLRRSAVFQMCPCAQVFVQVLVLRIVVRGIPYTAAQILFHFSENCHPCLVVVEEGMYLFIVYQ